MEGRPVGAPEGELETCGGGKPTGTAEGVLLMDVKEPDSVGGS